MALASSASVSALRLLPFHKSRPVPSLQVRAHKFEDQGRWSSRHDLFDTNLGILKKRIEEIKMKEKLERCYVNDHQGWNRGYAAPLSKLRSSTEPLEYIEIAGTVGCTFGLTILSGTLGLCLASVLLHFNQL